MKTAIYTPTRHPGISVSWLSVVRQTVSVDYWLVADQLANERAEIYQDMRKNMFDTKIETYQAEILPERVGNLEHVSNWALNRARELEVDLLIFLQDFIWMPPDGVAKYIKAAKNHPFDLITGRVSSSKGWDVVNANDLYNIFGLYDSVDLPPPPYEPDTRAELLWGSYEGSGKYLSNHAWEINYGALPYALINAGVDFDEDYDYGTQWGNTQFSFDISRKMGPGKGQVWWDYHNEAIALPHRDYFPKAHKGERDLDNGHRFWAKNPDLKSIG